MGSENIYILLFCRKHGQMRINNFFKLFVIKDFRFDFDDYFHVDKLLENLEEIFPRYS